MSNEHPYRPCPACGGVEFNNLPDLALEIHRTIGMGTIKVPGSLHVSLVVCSGCGKTDLYTRNLAQVASRVPGATQFRAAPRGTQIV